MSIRFFEKHDMDFNERVIPGVTSNFLLQESLARYLFAEKYARRGYKVLDAGCGTGYGTIVLAGKADVVGVDSNMEAIRFANEKYSGKVLFKHGNVQELDFKSSRFDLVVSFEVIEHLKRPIRFLNEVKRTMKEKGVFILSTPNKKISSPNNRLNSPYHLREYTFNELRGLLGRHFMQVEVYGQTRTVRASTKMKKFLEAQNVRQSIVDKDVLFLRKLIPQNAKETLWRSIADLFGNKEQKDLVSDDFPISKEKIGNCNYFIAVCKK